MSRFVRTVFLLTAANARAFALNRRKIPWIERILQQIPLKRMVTASICIYLAIVVFAINFLFEQWKIPNFIPNL